MTREGKIALLDITVFVLGIIFLVTGGAALIFANTGSAWPLIPSLLSILSFVWVASGISEALIK